MDNPFDSYECRVFHISYLAAFVKPSITRPTEIKETHFQTQERRLIYKEVTGYTHDFNKD